MNRRSFFATTGALTVGSLSAATLAAPAIAQGNHVWRMVTTWPKNFPGMGVGAQRLADTITAASDGRLTIQVYSAGELVPPLQSLDAVIDGSAEMSHGASYYWQNKSQALNFFTGVPFGMTSRELSGWVQHLGGQDLWDEVYHQFGVQAFLSGDTGVQAGGWFRNEIRGLDDLKGLRFRSPGLGGQVWGKLGATVTNLAGGEIFQALQSGALDAAEFVSPYNDLALGLYQVCKNYYVSSFVETGVATELVVNKEKYQALPRDLQIIIRECCQADYDKMGSDFQANDPMALRTLVSEHGVQVRQFPDEILEAGAKAAVEILTELRESDDPLTRKVTESYISSLALMRERTEGSELPYLNARARYFAL